MEERHKRKPLSPWLTADMSFWRLYSFRWDRLKIPGLGCLDVGRYSLQRHTGILAGRCEPICTGNAGPASLTQIVSCLALCVLCLALLRSSQSLPQLRSTSFSSCLLKRKPRGRGTKLSKAGATTQGLNHGSFASEHQRHPTHGRPTGGLLVEFRRHLRPRPTLRGRHASDLPSCCLLIGAHAGSEARRRSSATQLHTLTLNS